MPGGAASSNGDRREPFEVSRRNVRHVVEKYLTSVERDASLDGFSNCAWLLVDFLQHEMLEAALFSHDWIPGDSLDRWLNRVSFEVCNAHSLFVDDGNLSIAEKKHVARVLEDWWNIGG